MPLTPWRHEVSLVPLVMKFPVEGVGWGWGSVLQHACDACSNLEPCELWPGARPRAYIDSLLVVLVSSAGDSMQNEM
jgi:hypothetical protein